MLIGADPTHVGDRCIRVTIHHCFFDGTRQRHPRVRFGKVHLYNNYTRNWGIYAVCASVESQVNGYLFSLLIKCLKFSASSIYAHIFLSDFFFFFFCLTFIFLRYTLNATYMKQDRRKSLLNIIQRR